MGVGYHNLFGDMIYTMVTRQTDISYATVKLSHSSVAVVDIHSHGTKHCMRYLYATQRTQSWEDLEEHDRQCPVSTATDLMEYG